MAIYRQIKINDPDDTYIITPETIWESLKLAWYMYMFPDRIGALATVPEEFMETECEETQTLH